MKVLVASSGIPDEVANPIAATSDFPWPAGSEIHVLTVSEVIQPVVPGEVPGSMLPIIDVADVQERADSAAETTATTAAQHLENLGFKAEGIAIEGDPETAITGYARTWGADLIVVGTHHRSRVERLLLGSVAESIVKHAPCSVLVIRQRDAA